jgi:alpha-mannosidase
LNLDNGKNTIRKQKYWVVGLTHTDLAWKKGREEMAEIFDTFIVRLLDILDTEPSFTYMIEQAEHYRDLAKRRPDLFKQLVPYIQSGRLEMVGGMATSQDTNVPSGESFIRNQLLGLKWVRENVGVPIQTGMLIDTFGFHPQIPQILTQFGITRMFANRFGGNQLNDVFIAKGLDGSETLFVGRDSLATFVKPGHIFFKYLLNWNDMDQLFKEAQQGEGDGPFLVTPYTENEVLPSKRSLQLVEKMNEDGKEEWRFSTLSSFMDALEAAGTQWPIVDGDLNPEFTGTFSLRSDLRLRNRSVETKLLEAEKWASLLRLKGVKPKIEHAWWELGYIQFHDVLTGSHPTSVYLDCLQRIRNVESIAEAVLSEALSLHPSDSGSTGEKTTITLLNGLPWKRKEAVTLPLPNGWNGVSKIISGGQEVPFEVEKGEIKALLELPSGGMLGVSLEQGAAQAPNANETLSEVVLENEYIRLECSSQSIVKRLIWKATNTVLMQDVSDILVLQQDQGNFQIEEPIGAEIPANAGTFQIRSMVVSAVGQSVTMAGQFPGLPWLGTKESPLSWELTFHLAHGKPYLDLNVRLRWRGEQSRVRLKLTSGLNHAEGIFEIPFGVVRRKPYRERYNARGEWPVQRFAAIDNGEYGLALSNRGTVGVEMSGGSLWTTILRAPVKEYAGMIPDDTSSEHGEHTREFRIMPYAGKWQDAGIIAASQEFNNPILPFDGPSSTLEERENQSLFEILQGDIVLSSIKYAEDGSDELIVRFYETAGAQGTAVLMVKGAEQAWLSDLKESRLAPLACDHDRLQIFVKPFEITTIRVSRR